MFTYRLIMFKLSEIADFKHFPTHIEHPHLILCLFNYAPQRVSLPQKRYVYPAQHII